jgi:hypothetical protein
MMGFFLAVLIVSFVRHGRCFNPRQGSETISSTPEAQSIALQAVYPSSRIDLSNWNIQIPTACNGSLTTGTACEITKPQLATCTTSYFYVPNDDATAIAFIAPTRGRTTEGSINPRSELREMTATGVGAAWNGLDKTVNILEATYTVLRVPALNKTCTISQVFNSNVGPFIEFQYRVGYLIAEFFSPTIRTKLMSIALGQKFTYKIVVSNNVANFSINGVLKYTKVGVPGGGLYFKAGAYGQYAPTQAPNDYSLIYINSLTVTHLANAMSPTLQPTPMPTFSPTNPNPTQTPTFIPTATPSTATPSFLPTQIPTILPTFAPSVKPSPVPGSPTPFPTSHKTNAPVANPLPLVKLQVTQVLTGVTPVSAQSKVFVNVYVTVIARVCGVTNAAVNITSIVPVSSVARVLLQPGVTITFTISQEATTPESITNIINTASAVGGELSQSLADNFQVSIVKTSSVDATPSVPPTATPSFAPTTKSTATKRTVSSSLFMGGIMGFIIAFL